jgi:hypothetical protein
MPPSLKEDGQQRWAFFFIGIPKTASLLARHPLSVRKIGSNAGRLFLDVTDAGKAALGDALWRLLLG